MSAASFDGLDTERDLGSAAYRPEDFPGCESFHLPASEIGHYEGRLEFWDAVTETAWKVRDPTSIDHEQPSRRLGRIAEAGRVAAWLGDRVLRLGGSGASGCSGPQALADTGRRGAVPVSGSVAVAGAGDRRGRGPAAGGGAGGGPPPRTCAGASSTSTRRAGFRRFGCWCHGRHRCARPGWPSTCAREDGYREEATSRAFPGWTAEEIHRALTETPLSETAWRALERTALAMGAREGTTPEVDPLMHSVSARAQAKGRMEIVAAAAPGSGYRNGLGFHRGIGSSSVDFRARP